MSRRRTAALSKVRFLGGRPLLQEVADAPARETKEKVAEITTQITVRRTGLGEASPCRGALATSGSP